MFSSSGLRNITPQADSLNSTATIIHFQHVRWFIKWN